MVEMLDTDIKEFEKNTRYSFVQTGEFIPVIADDLEKGTLIAESINPGDNLYTLLRITEKNNFKSSVTITLEFICEIKIIKTVFKVCKKLEEHNVILFSGWDYYTENGKYIPDSYSIDVCFMEPYLVLKNINTL